ncbi:MAG: NAD(P)-dependent oxidoreductase [Pseudomonadota bacterium]
MVINNEKVIVTGSAGFLGKAVCRELLRAGHQVLGIDRRPQRLHSEGIHTEMCDITNRKPLTAIVRSFSPECIVHLAARTDLDETKDITGYAANTDGVGNIVYACEQTPSIRRVLYTSTQLVCRVGYNPSHDTDYCPSTLYGESKVVGERIVRDSDSAGKEWCLLRPTTIWGPGMSAHYVRFLKMIRKGWYFHVGKKPLYKSYGYVGNSAHQYRMLLKAPPSAIHQGTFYIADYEPLCLQTWADMIAAEMAAPRVKTIPSPIARGLALAGDLVTGLGLTSFPFTSFRLNNILTSYIVDMEATKTVCGPLPYSVREGVRSLVHWMSGGK